MQNKFTSRSKHLDFIIIDLVCVELSFWLAYYIRIVRVAEEATADYSMMNILVLLAHLAIVFIGEGYSGIMARGYLREFRKVAIHNAELFGVILFILFFTKQSSTYSRIMFALFVVINMLTMYAARCIRKRILFHNRNSEKRKGQMLVITTKNHVERLVKNLEDRSYRNYLLQGIVVLDEDMTGQMIEDIAVVSNATNMYEYVKSNIIDEIFLEYLGEDLPEIADRFLAMGAVVHVSINDLLPGAPNAAVENINHYTVITTSINLMSFKQKVIKRFMDIVASLIGIVITAVFFVIFAPIIYIQSPGPIFFKQERVGKNGRLFKIYKFRSMYMDAEERKKELMEQNKMSGLMFKMDDDPRVTPIGRFLRKTSIDEFPQFINIFKGDMSLVGTRPPTVDEYKLYEQHHKSRLAIKPGLTGMWQVSGRSEITDFEEVVRLDNEYIKKFSISLDIKILFKTVFAVLKRKGSQ